MLTLYFLIDEYDFIFSDLAFYGIYAGTSLAFGVVAVWHEKVFVVIATSFTGSMMFLLG